MYLAAYFAANKKFGEADNLLDRADGIYTTKLGAKNVYKAAILAQKGDIRRAQRQREEAMKLYEQSARIYKSIFGVSHPMYVSVYGKSGQIMYSLGNIKKAAEIAEFTTSQNLNFIQQFFPSMSEREKAKYWSVIKPDFEYYYTIALRFKDEKPKIVGKLYDITLATKAILLNSSVKTRQAILNSDNMELRNNYRNWLKRKEDLAAALEMTKAQQEAVGINVKQLEAELELIEKRLYDKSKEFREENEERYTSWPEIRKNLGQNEMAVEVVRFRYFEENFTDSVVYAAFVIKPTSKSGPDMIIWPMGKKLEEKYVNYYRNCMRFMLPDELSYKVFWEPLSNVIPTGTKLYFSPDGVFNQVNVETFRKPSGRVILDEQNIYVLANTKDLLRIKDVEARKRIVRNEAVLVGDPTFYDEKASKKVPASAKLSQLPGTAEEVASLDKILKNSRWETTTLVKTAADEAYIKSIRSPRVLHIATHGFFLEDLQLDTSTTVNLFQNRPVDNPLLRSGLVLNDGGELLLENDYRLINQREGVLTAYEAMNLNLDQTDMVVLSACETGLGEIMVGEGVYGLQRAFQIAGAKVVVMSLFKVSDQVTRELMQVFYNKWLVDNLDKRLAFLEAKKAIRNKYPQEKYWGSFVMIGAD
jgi:CHAT domain-containing protein